MTVGLASLLWLLAASPAPSDGAEALVQRTIQAHGAERLRAARVEFVFRGDRYAMTREGGRFRYERIRATEEGLEEKVVLDNEGVQVFIAAEEVHDSAESQALKDQGLNSVVYFASLPLPLLDPAVQAERLPDQEVKGVQHHVLKVSFRKKGGGTDHDDAFRYWLDPETGLIDYMAYSYARNEGGVRFRVARARHEVQGIVFTDWTNFGNEDESTPLDDLPRLWESGKLPKLSEIELEQLRVLQD